MKLSSLMRTGAIALLMTSTFSHATGMVPETSVIIIEQSDGEGSIGIKNTDNYPVLLLSALQPIPEDKAPQIAITPPAARVEPGKSQLVRFMLADKTPLQTEHLMRATFEGVPPQKKNENTVRMTVRQNLPVIIRPAGLAKDPAPWKRLTWKQTGNVLSVSNTSPYVVRLSQAVQTLPDRTTWMLPASYVLPGQNLTLKAEGNKTPASATKVRISPATNWGYSVENYDAELTH